MDDAILALDSGTSGLKSTLLIRRTAEPQWSLLTAEKIEAGEEMIGPDNSRRWSPSENLRQVVEAADKQSVRAAQNGAKVQGIAITCTTPSLVAMKGWSLLETVPPLRWDDQSSNEEAMAVEDLRKGLSDAFPWIGLVPSDMGLAKALRMTKLYGEALAEKSVTVFEHVDFLQAFLTGISTHSESVASRKWGFSSDHPWPGEFENRLNKHLIANGVPKGDGSPLEWMKSKFLSGRLLAAGDPVGPMLGGLAQAFRFSSTTKVIAAPYDTCSQVIGLGLLHRPDAVAVSMGTSMGICALAPVGMKLPFTSIGPIPDLPIRGRSMIFDGMSACASSISWLCETFNILKHGKPDLKRVEEALRPSATKPGASGILFLPPGGRRAKNRNEPKLIGFGGRVGRGDKEIDNLIRALFEGFAYIIRVIVEDFERFLSVRFSEILVGGGPATNMPFMQLLADATGRRVLASSYTDTALLGATICAATGLGWFSEMVSASHGLCLNAAERIPDVAVQQQYDRLFQEYKTKFARDINIVF